jgi:hypothetical protein
VSVFEATPVPGDDVDSFADQLVRRFEPWLTPDLETYLRAVASMFDESVLYAMDYDDPDTGEFYAGWEILFDPDRAPANALPYLAQYRGERLPSILSEAQAREWIKDAPNQERGTTRSVFEAAQRKLTGDRLVSLLERPAGVVDAVQVVTYAAQTPDPAGTQADILSVLPADVLLTYVVSNGAVWSDVKTANWTTTKAKTWNQLTSGLVGYSQFPRPRP